jgi:splicing factor U2AF subunit
LVKLLNAALSALKANTAPGEPVLSAWISTDGHYAFVEFRSADEANNGFLLNNISILGQPLKVGRPKTYVGAFSMMDDGNLCNTVAAALQAGTMNAPIVGRKVQFPTRVLCFKDMTIELNVIKINLHLKIESEEEFKDIYEDIKDECNKYGRVMSICIPRKDVEDNPTAGTGNVYVEFYTMEEAKEARRVKYFL